MKGHAFTHIKGPAQAVPACFPACRQLSHQCIIGKMEGEGFIDIRNNNVFTAKAGA